MLHKTVVGLDGKSLDVVAVTDQAVQNGIVQAVDHLTLSVKLKVGTGNDSTVVELQTVGGVHVHIAILDDQAADIHVVEVALVLHKTVVGLHGHALDVVAVILDTVQGLVHEGVDHLAVRIEVEVGSGNIGTVGELQTVGLVDVQSAVPNDQTAVVDVVEVTLMLHKAVVGLHGHALDVVAVTDQTVHGLIDQRIDHLTVCVEVEERVGNVGAVGELQTVGIAQVHFGVAGDQTAVIDVVEMSLVLNQTVVGLHGETLDVVAVTDQTVQIGSVQIVDHLAVRVELVVGIGNFGTVGELQTVGLTHVLSAILNDKAAGVHVVEVALEEHKTVVGLHGDTLDVVVAVDHTVERGIDQGIDHLAVGIKVEVGIGNIGAVGELQTVGLAQVHSGVAGDQTAVVDVV